MKVTTIKVSTETRDRIKSYGGETQEATILAALDALEEAEFWRQAEEVKRRFDSLPKAEQDQIRTEEARLDALLNQLR
jgi:hypothetical protein